MPIEADSPDLASFLVPPIPMPLRRDRSLVVALLLASLIYWCALAWPCWFGNTWYADDLGAFHLPIRDFYGTCLRQGVSFDWMNSLYGGYYFTGEGQAGAYHPWHLALYRFLPLKTAFAVEILANYPLLLAGTYLWLRRHVETSAAALFGAFCFTFGSFNVLHFVHVNAISVIAHLPWLFVCQARLGALGFRRATALAVPLLTASQILLGYPQYVWFTLLAEIAYGAAAWRRDARVWLTYAALKLLGLAAGAVQLLPTFDWLASSERVAESASYFTEYSVSPSHLLLFATPYLAKTSHEITVYLGVIPLACLVVGACRKPERSSRLWKYCAACAVAALLLAMGKYGGLFHLQRLLPVVSNFRVPARYLFLAQLALCPLLARGFQCWLTQDEPERVQAEHVWTKVFVAMTGMGITACLVSADEWRWASLAPPACAGIVWLLLRGSTSIASRASKVLVGLAWADLLLFGVGAGAFTVSMPPSADRKLEPPPGRATNRLALQYDTLGEPVTGRYSNELVSLGWRQIDGYSGLPPRNRLFGAGAGVSALRVANVQWVYDASVPEGFGDLAAPRDGWREVPAPLPRVRLVGQTLVSHAPRTDIETIDPARIALLEHPLDETLVDAADATLEVRTDRPGMLLVETSASEHQLLVFAERFHRGWRATVDDKPVEIVRVYGDFQGCVVTAGTHAVRFHFDPDSLRWGKRISIAALIVVLLIALLLGKSSRDVASIDSTATTA